MPDIPQATADKAAAIQATMNAKVASIRNNGELSPDGKRKAMARAYVEAEQGMTKLREAWQGNAAASSETLSKDLFGAASTAGMDAISARDADDRAAQLENARDAIALLERAEENGDKVLSRAIAQRAYRERGNVFGGWDRVLDAYLEIHPDVREKLVSLDNARRSTVQTNLMAGMIFSVPKPSEINDLRTTHALSAFAGIG